MEPIINVIAENWFWSVIGGVFVVWIAFATFESIITKAGRERSRREIAAYVAEGSMTPEQGERIMKAGQKDDGCC